MSRSYFLSLRARDEPTSARAARRVRPRPSYTRNFGRRYIPDVSRAFCGALALLDEQGSTTKRTAEHEAIFSDFRAKKLK